MTDITELAQREKFEAWWEREYKHLESSKYTDAVPHIKYGFWMAYQAGGAEQVEALEKAQRYTEELREWNAGLAQESCEREQRIFELENQLKSAENNEIDARCHIAELESRTVTVKLPEPPGPMSIGARTVYFGIVADVVRSFQDGLSAAGIKVEAK